MIKKKKSCECTILYELELVYQKYQSKMNFFNMKFCKIIIA